MLDNFPTTLLEVKALQEDDVSPEILFCLTDSEEKNGMKRETGHLRFKDLIPSVIFCVFFMCSTVLKRAYEKSKKTIDEESHQRLKDEATEKMKHSEYINTV